MGSMRSVLDSQAIRDFEDMRLQRANDPGRWPRYVVELDEAGEAVRRDLGVLLPDIASVELLDAASAPAGIGEDSTISMSWRTEAEKQRDLARAGLEVSHTEQASLHGSYSDVVRALIGSLAHRDRKLLVVAEPDAGLRVTAYLPRPWFGGSAGRMVFELTMPPARVATVEVAGSAECKGTTGTWPRGRSALWDVLAGTDTVLLGETPSASPAHERLRAAIRPEGHLQWASLAVAAASWALIAVIALISAADGGGSVAGAVVVMAVTLVIFGGFCLWTKIRYL